MTQRLHLGLFIYPAGHHIAGWRHPAVDAHSIAGVDYYVRAAQAAERGKFDLFFVGDMLAAREKDGRVIRESGLNNIEFDLDHVSTLRDDGMSWLRGDTVHHL